MEGEMEGDDDDEKSWAKEKHGTLSSSKYESKSESKSELME